MQSQRITSGQTILFFCVLCRNVGGAIRLQEQVFVVHEPFNVGYKAWKHTVVRLTARQELLKLLGNGPRGVGIVGRGRCDTCGRKRSPNAFSSETSGGGGRGNIMLFSWPGNRCGAYSAPENATRTHLATKRCILSVCVCGTGLLDCHNVMQLIKIDSPPCFLWRELWVHIV